MPGAPEPERVPFTGLLVKFAGELRAAGLAVGSGDVLLYCSALSRLDPADLVDLYWAGRATLVNRHDDITVYDQVFRRFFLAVDGPAEDPLMLMLRASAQAQGALAIPSTEPGESEREDDAVLGWMASDVEALKHKSFAACTPEELAALRRIMARIRLTPPRRRTRRTTAAKAGRRPDPATDRAGIHAHARRPGPAVLAPAEGKAAAADPHPGHLGFDGRLLAQPAAVRAFCRPLGRAGRGLLLRHPADSGDRGDGMPAPGRGAGAGRPGRVRLGRRHQDRRQPGRLRPGLGPPRACAGAASW